MAVLNHSFDQLDVHVLYQLLKLRVDVFVVEQACPYPELDNKDILPSTRHLYLQAESKLAAYARCLAPGVSFEQGSAIGRVRCRFTRSGSWICQGNNERGYCNLPPAVAR